MVSVRYALRPSMVSVTSAMRWSTAATACAAPVVSDVVRLPRRESIESIAWAVPSVSETVRWVRRELSRLIACEAPSVSDEASVPRRLSMVSVTDFARVSKFCSSDLRRPSIDSSKYLTCLAAERSVERFDLAVERDIEIGDAASQRGLELHQALVQRGGDVAAVGAQAGVEGVDIGLQAVRDVLGALTHALDDFAAEGFDGAVEFRDVAGDQGAKRAAVAREFLRQFAALVLHQFVERAHLQGERCRARFRSG